MKSSDATILGAYDAKTHFSELLERVAAGEELTITRNGTPVARMVPIRATGSPESRKKAIVAMRQLASRNQLAGLRVKDLIAEGRK
ncbi:MAG: type II toxin-antitoxin system prevent-host-death family antitoxin [Pirellulales bacterium]|nr:type II toxin-antitoxin system prevent-host-death family antitoxin [Pirellulales bacterium]